MPRNLFQKGNQFSKGNPNTGRWMLARKMAAVRRHLIENYGTPEKLNQIMDSLFNDALNARKASERTAASKLYTELIIGKAPQSVDVTVDDGAGSGVTINELRVAILNVKDPDDRQRLGNAIRELRLQQLKEEPSDFWANRPKDTNGTAKTDRSADE
jgi:hypothetical protein